MSCRRPPKEDPGSSPRFTAIGLGCMSGRRSWIERASEESSRRHRDRRGDRNTGHSVRPAAVFAPDRVLSRVRAAPPVRGVLVKNCRGKPMKLAAVSIHDEDVGVSVGRR
jgi:hypothetical protein